MLSFPEEFTLLGFQQHTQLRGSRHTVTVLQHLTLFTQETAWELPTTHVEMLDIIHARASACIVDGGEESVQWSK